jgi:DNA polymerase-1
MILTNETYKDIKWELETSSEWCVDVETNGLDPYGKNQICGLGICGSDGEFSFNHYFPFRHQQGENLSEAARQEVIGWLNDIPTMLIGYNLKFDLHFLANEGLIIGDKDLIDVLVMVRLTEPTWVRDLGLTDTIKRTYGDEAASYDIETKKYLRANKWSKDFSMSPPDILGPYCQQDVYWTHKLYRERLEQIKQNDQEAVFKTQCDLTKVLFDMERRGVIVDSVYANDVAEKLAKRKEEVVQAIYKRVGKEFNISSTQQLGEIFTDMGISSPVKTPKNKESWSEVALVQIDNELAGLVRQHRSLEKLQSTYINPYIETEDLHTSFCNWGTLTGRLSSREPNLQNIPRTHFKLSDRSLSEEEREIVKGRISAIVASKSKGELSEISLSNPVLDTWGFVGDESFDSTDVDQIAVRRLFIPRPEYTLVSFDYSQMEVRVFLSYLHNAEMDELLSRDEVDFHGEAAKIAFSITEEHPEFKFYRQMAKNITFGILYGLGNKRLAQQLSTTTDQAKAYKQQYFNNIYGSRSFINRVISTVESRGWIKNRYGRIYKIDNSLGYKGVNYLVQGTSADILNERMIYVHEYLKDKKSNILLQVHDEIICEIHDDEIRELPQQIQLILEANSLDIPLKVDIDVCEGSWAVKSEWNKWSVPEVKCDIIEEYIDWD